MLVERLGCNKWRFLKKLTCKGTLRQMLYLSEAPSLPSAVRYGFEG
jgi:hypothetical protein